MKKLIFIALLSYTFILYSQDREPSAWQFKWGYSDSPRVFEPDSFKQTTMLNGFQWYGSRKMNDALLNNTRAAGCYYSGTGNENNPLFLVHQPYWVDGAFFKPGYFNAPFMQYEPTLLLEDTTFGKILRPADSSNPVFGFKYIKGTILTNSTNENYSRLILTKADKPSYGGDIVLKEILPQPKFRTREFIAFTKSGQTDNYLGRKWYLTINLRRLNPEIETIVDDSVVMSLQIPYTLGNGMIDTIRFNKLPINHRDSVELLNYFENRGYSQLLEEVTPTKELRITRRIIPTQKS